MAQARCGRLREGPREGTATLAVSGRGGARKGAPHSTLSVGAGEDERLLDLDTWHSLLHGIARRAADVFEQHTLAALREGGADDAQLESVEHDLYAARTALNRTRETTRSLLARPSGALPVRLSA